MKAVICPGGKKRYQLQEFCREMVAVLSNWIGGMLCSTEAYHLSFGRQNLGLPQLRLYKESHALAISEDSLN